MCNQIFNFLNHHKRFIVPRFIHFFLGVFQFEEWVDCFPKCFIIIKFWSRHKECFWLVLRTKVIIEKYYKKECQLRFLFRKDISCNYIFELGVLIGRSFVNISLFKNCNLLQQFYISKSCFSKKCFMKIL